MRELPTFLRLLICGLLLGGYGAMYAGSVKHDLGHLVEKAHDAEMHHSCDHAVATHDDATHLEIDCFFCSHGPVLAASHTTEQVWTLAVESLALPFEVARTLHTSSVSLRELRGPPAA
jgi:hypothetical protein